LYLQARQEAAARAVLEAAKKAGAAGELLSPKELQAVAQAALNPPKEAPAPARVSRVNWACCDYILQPLLP
jgi:hypothetical protein